MADYYTHLSFEFKMPDEEAANKTVELLARIDEAIENESMPEDLVEFTRFVKEGMQSSIVVEADGEKVWVRDDCGCPFLDVVVAWLKEALKRYHPEGAIGFEFSNDCSKHRSDAFGGGAVFITKDNEKWMNTWQWLADCEKEWVADGAEGKAGE